MEGDGDLRSLRVGSRVDERMTDRIGQTKKRGGNKGQKVTRLTLRNLPFRYRHLLSERVPLFGFA